MGRKNQQLINYHTGSKTNMPLNGDVQFGEIVVRHNYEEPQLMIKVSSGTSGTDSYGEWFVPFISSGKVSTEIDAAITEAQGTISSEINNLEQKIDAVSATVKETYWTSATTKEYVDNAKNEAIETASGYTDTQIIALSGSVVEAIDGVTGGDLSNLKSRVQQLEVFSGKVETDYATKEFVGAASGYAYNQAKEDLIGTSTDAATADTIWGAKNYASSLTKTLSGDAVTAIEAEKTRATSAEESLGNRIDAISGSVSAMSADIKTYIDTELSVVYKFKGTVANEAALNAITGQENGDVYNVTSEIGTFGEEGYYPAGTNFAWDADANDGEGRWDALGGAFQTENLATSAELDGVKEDVEKLNSTVSELVTNVSGGLETLSAKVETDYATKEFVGAASGYAYTKALEDASATANTYTDQQIAILSGISSAYTNSKTEAITNEINNIKNNYAVSSITDTAIATAKSEVIGEDGDASTADTIHGAKKYTDEKVDGLSGNVTTLVNNLSGITSGQIATLSANVETAIGSIQSDVTDLKTSAATWNQKVGTAIQGAEFAAVSSSDTNFDGGEGSGATVDSNAKLSYTEGGKIKLDLSELIIDCGDF